MSEVLFLDSGPLGLLTHPLRSLEVIRLTDWVSECLVRGRLVMVPAIVYYELKRELLRAGRSASVTRLDAFVNATPGRYVPLSDEALRLAAEIWAAARQRGKPTAEAKALDIDVLIAAQALSFTKIRSSVVIATTNVRHLSQFAEARHWKEIVP